MTHTEMFEQFTDPRTLLTNHRRATMATLDGLQSLHAELRTLTEDGLGQSFGEIDAWMRPARQAGEEIAKASFDLHKRALEVTRTEIERWYETLQPTEG